MLSDRLGHAPTRPAQWAVAECWLLGRLRPRESKYGLLTRALYSLAQGQRGSVRSTCADLGLGNERMIRVFRRLAGLPPKALARVQRFHGALAPLAGGREPLVDLALRLGFYDQAHFNHEFFRLAGVAPGEFVRRRGEDEESLIDD
jgi:methylphosphotriester-DNA--protein-cysteine methyltransferase